MLGTDLSAKALADMLVQWDLEAGNTPRDHWLALTVLQYGTMHHVLVLDHLVFKIVSVSRFVPMRLPRARLASR
jgi:hypothetical protein